MADIADKFTVKYWKDTGQYYCYVIFPDGSRQELKSDTDLNFAGWMQEKIVPAWDAIQNPPKPVAEVTLAAASVEELKATIAKRGLTAADLGLEAKVMEPIGEVGR